MRIQTFLASHSFRIGSGNYPATCFLRFVLFRNPLQYSFSVEKLRGLGEFVIGTVPTVLLSLFICFVLKVLDHSGIHKMENLYAANTTGSLLGLFSLAWGAPGFRPFSHVPVLEF